MKRCVYLLVMFMLGLSCALWTGCSDDDNDGQVPTPPENPGDTIVPSDTTSSDTLVVDTIFRIKSVRINNVYNQGFYTQVDLTETGNKITHMTIQGYAPNGDKNGRAKDWDVEYKGNTAVINHDDAGYEMQYVFTLDTNGYALKIEDYDISEGEPNVEYMFECSYDPTNGMLKQIYYEDEDVMLFDVAFDGQSNWKTYLFDPQSGAKANCKISEDLNNYTIDLNLLAFFYGQFDPLSYAVLLGFFPATPNVLESMSAIIEDDDDETRSLSKAGSAQKLKVSTNKEGDKITSVTVNIGTSVKASYQLGY